MVVDREHLRDLRPTAVDSDRLPYEAARSRVLLAQAYEAMSHREEAELERDAAVAAFESLGARADLARITEHAGQPRSSPGR